MNMPSISSPRNFFFNVHLILLVVMYIARSNNIFSRAKVIKFATTALNITKYHDAWTIKQDLTYRKLPIAKLHNLK